MNEQCFFLNNSALKYPAVIKGLKRQCSWFSSYLLAHSMEPGEEVVAVPLVVKWLVVNPACPLVDALQEVDGAQEAIPTHRVTGGHQ